MKPKVLWHLIWVLPMVLALSLFFGWLDHRAMQIDVSPEGGPDPFFGMFPLVMVQVAISLFSCCAIPFTVLLCFSRRWRWFAVFLLLVSLTYCGGLVAQPAVFGSPRLEAFNAVGERLTPLIEAIETYHVDHQEYPETLDQLVPDYLPELPGTGMENYKEYRYIVAPRGSYYGGNPWVIQMHAGYGMGFDTFTYFPNQNYPRAEPITQLGRWAYIHD